MEETDTTRREVPDREVARSEVTIERLGALAGGIAGGGVFLYLVGGAVLWVRYWRLGVPADEAVGLVPTADLVVVGVRVLVLPALLSGALFLLIVKLLGGRAKLLGGRAYARPTRGRLALLSVPLVVQCLVVPYSIVGFVWPAAAVAIAFVWLMIRNRTADTSRLRWQAVVVAVLGATLISIATESYEPSRVLEATVTVKGSQATPTGVLITHKGTVAIGIPGSRGIIVYPAGQVTSIRLRESTLGARAPARSLISRLLGGEPWALTPLNIWCGNERYGWAELRVVCRTQPAIQARFSRFDDGQILIRVRCPITAKAGCSGFVNLRTVKSVTAEGQGRITPLHLEPSVYQMDAGRSLEVRVRVDASQRRCLARNVQ